MHRQKLRLVRGRPKAGLSKAEDGEIAMTKKELKVAVVATAILAVMLMVLCLAFIGAMSLMGFN